MPDLSHDGRVQPFMIPCIHLVLFKMIQYRHGYHLVDPSPWPFLMAMSVFTFAFGLIFSFKFNASVLILGALSILSILFLWFRDISRESLSGHHTTRVQSGLVLGVLLFLTSEIMLFFSFFWAYFHAGLAPSLEIGSAWPPVGIEAVDPTAIPLLGSLLLVYSGATCTVAHNALLAGRKTMTLYAMTATVLFGALFLILQITEYRMGAFSLQDSVFGSAFYMTTGLHGLHVLIGVLFLSIVTLFTYFDFFTTHHHLGFEFSLWYWHLVDVVWLIVFLVFYWWPS